jgi:hypothetical protein
MLGFLPPYMIYSADVSNACGESKTFFISATSNEQTLENTECIDRALSGLGPFFSVNPRCVYHRL